MKEEAPEQATVKPPSVILDEIEERAKTAHFSYSSSGSGIKLRDVARIDVPALIKALRHTLKVAENLSPIMFGALKHSVTAILNQKQQDHGN